MLDADINSFTYLGSQEPAILDVHEAFSPGLTLVHAANGTGKSTLAMLLCGAIPHIVHGSLDGQVEFCSQILRPADVAKIASYVPQDPLLYFVRHRCADECSLFRNSDFARDHELLVEQLIPRVAPAFPIYRLSGGLQQRLAIVSSLCSNRPVVLLDEPYEFLDEATRPLISDLVHLKAEAGAIVVVFDSSGTTARHLRPNHAVTLRDENPRQDYAGTLSCTVASRVTCRNDASSSKTALSAHSVAFRYSETQGMLFEGVNLDIGVRRCIGLRGPNGVGKTSLQLLFSGLLRPLRGEIRVDGHRVSAGKLRDCVRMVFQNPDKQLFASTVEEELLFGLRACQLTPGEITERIQYAESLLPFALSRDPFSLSYGQRKFLCFVCAIIVGPRALMLDEPTASLDSVHKKLLLDLLREYLEQGGAALLATHNGSVLEEFCDSWVEMTSWTTASKPCRTHFGP